MTTQTRTLDARHDAFLAEIETYAEACGCSFQGNPAYHDRMPNDQAERLAFDYSACGLAERLRCDKRMLNPVAGLHIPVEAKTSYRADGIPQYLFEAYQIGLHKGMRDGCLYAVRKVCGDMKRDCGFRVTDETGAGSIREIRIPDLVRRGGSVLSRTAGECQDGVEFYKDAFGVWFPGVPVTMTNTNQVCRGSGDPYAVMSNEFMESLPDWRSMIYEFAFSHE